MDKKIGILFTSRNNYNLLYNWLNKVDTEGFDILNIDEDSDDKNIIINNNMPIDKGISSDEKLIMQLIIQLASELIESTHQGKLSLNSELINEQGKHYLSLDFSINNLANQGSFYSQLQMVCKQRSFESDINFDATLELRFFISIFKMLGGKNITVHERGKTTSINLSLLVNTVELLPVSVFLKVARFGFSPFIAFSFPFDNDSLLLLPLTLKHIPPIITRILIIIKRSR